MRNYNFYITIGETTTQVTPRYESMTRQWRRQDGQVFHRIELDVTLTFQRADYDLIMGAAFDTEYTLTVYEVVNGSETLYFTGVFRRTDLDVNQDDKTVSVKPEPKDRYERVMSSLDKEFDLFDIEPAITPVTYVKQPLIQHYVLGTDYITSFIGGTWFETPLDITAVTSGTQLENDYQFSKSLEIFYIPGGDGLTPDVSGIYISNAGNGDLPATRQDSAFEIVNNNVGSGGQFEIRDKNDSDNVVYAAPTDGLIFAQNPFVSPNNASRFTLTSTVDGTSEVSIHELIVYSRILTDVETVGATPTSAMPDPDLSNLNFGYDYVLGYTINTLTPYSGATTTPTRYGARPSNAVNNADEYFEQYVEGLETTYPVSSSEWQEYSLWFNFDNTLRTLQEDGAKTFNLTSAFKVSDVLSALLGEIDSSITHSENSAYSEFLYASSNPITSDAQRYLIITPKSNVVVGDYDQPAQKAVIKLGELLNMLKYAYNLWWYIDSSDRFVIEHYKYFNLGKNYSTAQTTIDTTTSLESRTGKAWAYKANRYTFEKGDIPEQIRLKWMDEVSTPFEGYPINVVSNYAQKGNIKERNISLFTSDIDYIQSQPNEINKNGFVLFECELDGSDYVVPFVEFTVASDEAYKMQNGHASWIYLADKYHRDGLPTASVTINKQSITANSVLRKKIQELTFPMPDSFDELELVTTGLGNAQIEEIDEDTTHKIGQFKLVHETE